jgi:hypothetical protein
MEVDKGSREGGYLARDGMLKGTLDKRRVGKDRLSLRVESLDTM